MTMFTCMTLLTRVNCLRTGLYNINSGLHRYAIRVVKQCVRHMTWNCDVWNDKRGTPYQVYYNWFYRGLYVYSRSFLFDIIIVNINVFY